MSYLFGETLLMTEYLVFSDVTSRSIRRLHHRPSPGSRLGRHLEQIRLLAVKLRRQLHLGMTKKGSKYPSTEYHRPKKTTIRYVYIRIYIYIYHISIYISIYICIYICICSCLQFELQKLSATMQSDPSPSNEQRVQTPQETHLLSSIRNYYHLLPSIFLYYHLLPSMIIHYHLLIIIYYRLFLLDPPDSSHVFQAFSKRTWSLFRSNQASSSDSAGRPTVTVGVTRWPTKIRPSPPVFCFSFLSWKTPGDDMAMTWWLVDGRWW